MSMDLGSKGSFKADINVTPLVDVMLVLLIIMMLIAPMLHEGVPLTLPEADNAGDKPDTQGQTVVAIDSRSHFYVNLIPVTDAELVPRVRRALEEKTEKVVYVKGDKDAKYSAVMDALGEQDYDEIVISTHPEGKSHWLERGVVEKARERFTVPVTHVVTDLAAEREEIRS